MQIAIDGPASSGKSSVAVELSKQLGITYIDTGAMYRAVTYALLKNNIDLENEIEIKEYLPQIDLEFKLNESGVQEIYVNGQNAAREIRTPEVTAKVSLVSAYGFVREALVEQQQAMSQKTSVVMDGRDIGTVVLPGADYKFYLNASSAIRAKRRYDEQISKGITSQTLEEIEQSIIERDYYDSNREIGPLTKAEDALEIDSSYMSIKEVVNKIKQLIGKETAQK